MFTEGNEPQTDANICGRHRLLCGAYLGTASMTATNTATASTATIATQKRVALNDGRAHFAHKDSESLMPQKAATHLGTLDPSPETAAAPATTCHIEGAIQYHRSGEVGVSSLEETHISSPDANGKNSNKGMQRQHNNQCILRTQSNITSRNPRPSSTRGSRHPRNRGTNGTLPHRRQQSWREQR